MPSNNKNTARATAFRAFADSRADPEAARTALGISPRSWQRFRGSSNPPSARLLDAIADSLADEPRLAEQLRRAAQPAEAPHA